MSGDGHTVMSPMRSRTPWGRSSHQGRTPTEWTTARHPEPTPIVDCSAVADRASVTRLPGRLVSWSISGALQQTSPTTTAASTQRRAAAPSGGGRKRRVRTAQATAAAASPAAGATKVRCEWMAKLATSTVSGSRRSSPQATDQARKTSSARGSSGADEFHTSL